MTSTDAPTMHVKIYSPFKTYYDGQANSLSAVNKTGPFDILPRHKNFMSLLVPCVITVRAPGKDDFRLNITRGVMHVKSDKTTLFLDV
jgi:F0F1-type ATP synthase epsilon subunit